MSRDSRDTKAKIQCHLASEKQKETAGGTPDSPSHTPLPTILPSHSPGAWRSQIRNCFSRKAVIWKPIFM